MSKPLSIVLIVLALLVNGAAQPLEASARKKLDNDIRYLVGQYSKYGEVAVAVADGEGIVSQVRGAEPFPLASVFKLPLLLAILDSQKKGSYPRPGQLLTIENSDLCIGSGRLADQGAGSSVAVDKACRLMMSISDNTATDLLFRRLGNSKLDPWLSAKGYKSSQILLTNRQAWLLSLGKVPGWGTTSPETRIARWEKLDRSGKLALAEKIEQGAANLSLSQFQAVENASLGTQSAYQDNQLAARLDNVMSAEDLAGLLVQLDQGQLLSDEKRAYAFQILAGQKYHTRLPKKLSPQTQIYHKTGTLSGVINDAGLIIPAGRQDGVAVVFLSKYVTQSSKMDALAAQIAKLVETAYRT